MYGAVLGRFGVRPCAERPCAWQYGPVFPKAYSAHRDNRIDYDRCISDFEGRCPDSVKDLIDEAIGYFGRYSTPTLTNWACCPGSPWSLCSDGGDILYGYISDEIIKSYFQNRVLKPLDVCSSEILSLIESRECASLRLNKLKRQLIKMNPETVIRSGF